MKPRKPLDVIEESAVQALETVPGQKKPVGYHFVFNDHGELTLARWFVLDSRLCAHNLREKLKEMRRAKNADVVMALAALLAHRQQQMHDAKNVVTIVARNRLDRPDRDRCDLCRETLLEGSHGPGVCVGPAVPTPAGYEPGKAQQAHGSHRGKPS